MENTKEQGERLTLAIKSRGYDVGRFADLIGMSRTSIYKMVGGKFDIQPSLVQRIYKETVKILINPIKPSEFLSEENMAYLREFTD